MKKAFAVVSTLLVLAILGVLYQYDSKDHSVRIALPQEATYGEYEVLMRKIKYVLQKDGQPAYDLSMFYYWNQEHDKFCIWAKRSIDGNFNMGSADKSMFISKCNIK